jgi:sugar phosphate isomerase/epimerase
MFYSRRDLGKIALASLPAIPAVKMFGAGVVNSKFNNVQIGAITYSFRTIPDLDEVIKMMVDIGLGEAELMSDHAERFAGAPLPAGRGGQGGSPPGGGGGGGGRGQNQMTPEQREAAQAAQRARAEELRKWRGSVSMDKYKEVRKKFDDAGIQLALLCFNMNERTTDDEIEYAFQFAKALGVKGITTSTQVTVSKRIAPFADKHKMMVGFHGHDQTSNPNEFSSLETFATAMSYSKYHGVNLDIGHFTAANFDPLPYIKENHGRIIDLHLKDRKKDHGPNTPWGEGDTPIKEVLRLLAKEKYPFPANIEFEYRVPDGSTLAAEMSKCLKYCKDALA